LRDERYCYFHTGWRQQNTALSLNVPEHVATLLPVLEDANSVQVALNGLLWMLATKQIEHRTAALMLYALQTASVNIKHTSFQSLVPTHVVIDRDCVERRPIGASAWSANDQREYDNVTGSGPEMDGPEYGPEMTELLRRQKLDRNVLLMNLEEPVDEKGERVKWVLREDLLKDEEKRKQAALNAAQEGG